MKLLLAFALFPALALADPPQVAHVDIVDGKSENELVLALPPSGDAELAVNGPVSTRVRLHKAALGLEFEVEHVGADHTSFKARGEVVAPQPGKKITLVKIPRVTGEKGGGSTEVLLTLR